MVWGQGDGVQQRVVAVEDGDAVRRQVLEYLALGPQDTLPGIAQIFNMGVAHVGDDGNIGPYHLAQIAYLAEVVHARLDDGGAVLRRQAQERQRRADVVVVIGLGLKRLEALGQHRGDHLLRRRLAGGTGDLHDREREAPTVPRSERAQGEQRVVHKNVELAGLQRSGRVHGQAAAAPRASAPSR